MPLPEIEGSCLCLPCQLFYYYYYFACYIWILNLQIKFFPSLGLSDWFICLTKVTCCACLVWTLMNGFSCASILLTHIICLGELHPLCRSSVTSSSPSSSSNVQYLQIYASISIRSLCKHVSMLTLAAATVDVSKPLKKSWNTWKVEEILSCTLASPCYHPLSFHGPLILTWLRHYLNLEFRFWANPKK